MSYEISYQVIDSDCVEECLVTSHYHKEQMLLAATSYFCTLVQLQGLHLRWNPLSNPLQYDKGGEGLGSTTDFDVHQSQVFIGTYAWTHDPPATSS
ncbi:hypothetical protein TNCV_3900971 [Trichonephila clavipes]|nr:hypothetical protein TNCV_3900971 [Trichonephila clavipes]